MRLSPVLLGALALLAPAMASTAKPVTTCPEGTQLCYSVSVPSSTSSSGKGDIFLQIRAPALYEWAALGQGTQMAGANIFMMYLDAAGTNMTLSPRLGLGEFEPQHDTAAQVELLEGSGVADGMMTANFRCSNCNSWSGGSMSLSDSASSWIFSYKQGSAVKSNSPSATVPQHDAHGNIQFDLTKAVGGSDSINPFLAQAASNVSSTPPAATGGSSSSGSSSSSSSSSSSEDDSDSSMVSQATIAHGTLMCAAVVLLLPVGALLRRVAPGSSIWVHAGAQTFALAVVTAGVGLGIYVALQDEELNDAHPIIGLVVFSLLWLQPVWGMLQHAHYRSKASRGPFGWVHSVVGVAVILLGMVNAGLGLQLATTPTSGQTAYIVIVVVLVAIYAAVIAWTAVRNRKTARTAGRSERSEKSGVRGGNVSEDLSGARK